MANAKSVEISAKINGKNVKEQVLGYVDAIKGKLDAGPKEPPVAIKKTVTKKPEQPKPAAAPVEEDELTFRQMLADMGVFIPTWKRALVASVASLLSGYVVGATFNALFNYMFAASIMASGWTFLTIVAAVVAFIAATYVSCKVAARVLGYVGSGKVDAHASAAWGWTKGLFADASPQTV